MKSGMNKRVFLDTSAFFKEYHDEEGFEYLHTIFDQAKHGQIIFAFLSSLSVKFSTQ